MRRWLKIGAWALYYTALALILLACACLWALTLLPLDRLQAVNTANKYGEAHAAETTGGDTFSPPFRYAPPAPGAGPGLVWVNMKSKVYHYPRCRWYGNTVAGKYVSEGDAIAEGDRADKTERRPADFPDAPPP